MYLRNDLAFFEAALGAGSIGAYPVAVNWHYTEEEARYVLEDSEARAWSSTPICWSGCAARSRRAPVLAVATPPEIADRLRARPGGPADPGGRDRLGLVAGGFEPRSGRARGATALSIIYTSGTTGHPKGVKRPPYTQEEMERVTTVLAVIFGLAYFEDPGQIVTAIVGPIYHSAPNTHGVFCYRVGASIHICPRFDPEGLLALIERERITHLHLVPIMFERLLKLPEDVRRRYDTSSLSVRGPRRGAVLARDQAGDDRVVGPDRPRVLRLHRGRPGDIPDRSSSGLSIPAPWGGRWRAPASA